MKSISVAKIFYLAIGSGLLNMCAAMYIMNGLLGHAEKTETLVIGAVVGSLGIWMMRKTINVLKPVWKVQINLSK